MDETRARLLFVDAARVGSVLGIERLGQKYSMRTASDPYAAILEARTGGIDLVLLTLATLGTREQEILQGMRDAARQTPLLLLLPSSSRASDVEARARGASSVLAIPCYFEDLERAVEGAIRRSGPTPTIDFMPLSQVAGTLAEAQGDLPTLSERMLRVALERTTATRGSLFVLEENGGSIYRCAAAVGISSDLVKAAQVRRGEGILGRIVERGEPLLVADVNRADIPRSSEPRSYRTVSFVSMPVRTADTVLAVLSVADREDGQAFSEGDMRSLADIAELAAPYVETARHVKRVESLSTVDPLTGLFNRRHFDRCLEAETIRARRYGRNLTLVLLDIDDFKRYNDRFGYLAGDDVLKGVAEILKERFRQVDIVTRWGGEEFAVLLPETGKPQPAEAGQPGSAPIHFADRVRRAVEQHVFPHANETPAGRITVSGGLAAFPTDTSDPRELVTLANRALRKAKDSGKNRICLL
ncbi:MAG: sensor domain-containing diguanylate cyclase [Planctomycetes bacterium]|nr:sensor domain-containing diguanylate cyclase [Planctomycetota bacterium]MBI3848568.1 sensor domain-containing diguanylate cyclase [Planctomycetota bacterium]